MHLEDGSAALHVGWVHLDLSVEAARADKCLVKDVCPVSRCENHNPVVPLKAVHLCEELVDGLLALVIPLAKARTALTAHRVNLIDEYYAWSRLLGICEEVTHSSCADPSKDLHKLRSGYAEERHASLASHSLRQQGLSRPWRSNQKSPFWDLSAQVRVARCVLQEVDNFYEFLLGPIATGNVIEFDLSVAILHNFCRGLPELKWILAAHARRTATRADTAKEQQQACNEPGNGSGKARKEV
mmetsp:Transcript_81146/g.238450  ORF Transcript_81146/g.238450 Transcript_81146/m.238450 type:complete len:242 (-) Transcript_81146:145-870(-)